jgi:membrane-bound lytic murein transglycosylase B
MKAHLSRRQFLSVLFAAALTNGSPLQARSSQVAFAAWVERFRKRAIADGISNATYARTLASIKPDTSVYALQKAQPEFREQLWQYLNRRVSEWRISIGRQRASEHADLLARIERDYGVDRYTMLGLWGMETAFGEVVLNPKHMRPIIPALAALAWGEPKRRSYWEKELLNALEIIQRGWAEPDAMVGSWAGAMGHTQWMPEVWRHMGNLTTHSRARRASFNAAADIVAVRHGVTKSVCRSADSRLQREWPPFRLGPSEV